jgi:hypothetical protein
LTQEKFTTRRNSLSEHSNSVRTVSGKVIKENKAMSINIKLYYYRNGERNPVTDIRRLRVPAEIAFDDLVNKIRESQTWVQDGSVSFKYVDEENDLVQFSSNDEWQIALDVLRASNDKLLRIRVTGPNPARENRGPWGGCGGWRRRQHCPFVAQQCGSQQPDFQNIFAAAKPFVEGLIESFKQANETQESSESSTSNQPSEPIVRHFGITCDGCDQENIIGDRFKCADCPNFDYCGTCFNTEELRKSHGESHKFVKIDKPVHHQHGFHGFDFSQALNHPLAQQFVSQFQGQNAQHIDLNQLLSNYQPFIQQFVQNLTGEQQTTPEEQKQPSAPAPQPTEEEVVINESDAPKEEIKEQLVQHQAQLDQLASMGFTNAEQNKELLTRYGGNVSRVVQILLQ